LAPLQLIAGGNDIDIGAIESCNKQFLGGAEHAFREWRAPVTSQVRIRSRRSSGYEHG
jgi:hypothetical protein